MGGWMTYRRMRARGARQDDLERMERDYLAPVYPQPPFATRPAGSDPLTEAARELGLDVETVRRVLTYVFREQP